MRQRAVARSGGGGGGGRVRSSGSDAPNISSTLAPSTIGRPTSPPLTPRDDSTILGQFLGVEMNSWKLEEVVVVAAAAAAAVAVGAPATATAAMAPAEVNP